MTGKAIEKSQLLKINEHVVKQGIDPLLFAEKSSVYTFIMLERAHK